MTQVVRIEQPGGPEQMKLVQVDVGEPGPNEVQVRHHAIGLNYIDIYQRSGLASLPLPLTPGIACAGVGAAAPVRRQPGAGTRRAGPVRQEPALQPRP